MPTPTVRDVHVDAVLTQMSVAYRQTQSNFIANDLFPEIPVDKMSDLYYVYDKGDWFRDEADVRAPGTESQGSGYRIGTDTYTAKVYAFHKDIDDQTRANYDNPLNPDRDAVEFVTNRMLMRQERDWAATCFKTGVWATDATGVNSGPTGGQFLRWNDATSTPVEDMELAKETMLSTTGFLPNTLVLGYQVFRYLKQHPAIYNRLKYTTSENITVDILARFFDVDRVVVARSIVNTGNRNAAGAAVNGTGGGTDSFSFVHGKHALLMYVNPSPSLLQPSAGYRFGWRGVSDGMGATVGISRFRMPELRSERIESQMAWTNKVVAKDLGYFFAGAVA
jgi:hypothetical protein